MEKLKKEKLMGQLMGASSFFALYSFFLIILHFASHGEYGYPLLLVVPVFIVSLPLWIYTLYNTPNSFLSKLIKSMKNKNIL